MLQYEIIIFIFLFNPTVHSSIKVSNTVNTWAGALNYTEDWDYVNVRKGAHLFWWLYAVQDPAQNRPLFLWLQGGPGSSSTGYGNFEELGPKDLDGEDRESTWLQLGDLVFVDNPVGTGFSYVESTSAYTRDVEQIGKDLVAWAVAFFFAHPEYNNRPFFIICESYGGKMSAEFARQLIPAVKSGVIPLKKFGGVALGDSWISAMDYVNTWGDFLYTQSYLDQSQLQTVNNLAADCQKLANDSEWSSVTNCWGRMESLISTETGGVSWYNILKYGGEDQWSSKSIRKPGLKKRLENLYNRHVNYFYAQSLTSYMNKVARKKLGIIPDSVSFGGQAGYVFSLQSSDFMKPNYDTVDTLLSSGIQVIVFNGQLDLICDTIGTERWIKRLQWPDLDIFQKAKKKPFETKSFSLAGFVKNHSNFELIYILRSGHMVAHDTPESALFVLEQLIQSAKYI